MHTYTCVYVCVCVRPGIAWQISLQIYAQDGGTRWRSWLRHCATNRKVAGSIPDGVIGIFHWRNPAGRTMALGLTQPLTEMSTRNISWRVKAAGAYDWQPYHLHVPMFLKSGSLNLLESSGPVQAYSGIALPFTFMLNVKLRWSTTRLLRSRIAEVVIFRSDPSPAALITPRRPPCHYYSQSDAQTS